MAKKEIPNRQELLEEAKGTRRTQIIFYGIAFLLLLAYMYSKSFDVSLWLFGVAVVLLFVWYVVAVSDPSKEVEEQIAAIEAEVTSQREREEAEKRALALEEEAKNQALAKEMEAKKQANERAKEKARLEALFGSLLQDLTSEFDHDGNGQVDIVETDDFQVLLNKNESKIIDINPDYVQHFVQVSLFLKTKRSLIQKMFELVSGALKSGGERAQSVHDLDLTQFGSQSEICKPLSADRFHAVVFIRKTLGISNDEAKNALDAFCCNEDYPMPIIPLDQEKAELYVGTFKDEVHLYNLLLVHAFAMVEALVQNKMVVFYELHQKFDDLNVFDSKHQRDVIKSLHSITASVNQVNVSLGKINRAIHDLGANIVLAIGDLSSITKESAELVESALVSVDSSIKANNLISAIQTYQLHRISKNTQSPR